MWQLSEFVADHIVNADKIWHNFLKLLSPEMRYVVLQVWWIRQGHDRDCQVPRSPPQKGPNVR